MLIKKNLIFFEKFKRKDILQRHKNSHEILEKYPDRIPVIIDTTSTIDIYNNKYIVPKDLTLSQFIYTLRKRIEIEPHQAIFILIDNKLMNVNKKLIDIYEQYKDADGFLYVVFSLENTFG